MKEKLNMKEILDENFAKSLLVYAQSILRGKGDPWELINGAYEYLKKNEEKYKDHPNIKAIAILKMKNLHKDEFRKNKRFTSITDEKGQDLEIADEKQLDISDKINLSSECNKVLSVIKSMGEKCREILMLAADDLAYKEMAETIDTPIGTVMSRLANCRKELKGLMST